MKIKSGELYFISERDVLTAETCGYYKIGLVKDSRRGGTDNRLEEHQTGNPRRLEIIECIQTPAIEDLETSMHHRFATDRILGEWFQLAPSRLADAVAMAMALAAEQANHVQTAERATQLDKELSTGEVRAATENDLQWQRQFAHTKVLSTRISGLQKRSDAIFKAAIDQGHDVSPYARMGERVGTSFAKDKLAEAHPDLYARYVKIDPRLSHTVRPATPKTLLDTLEPEPDFIDLEQRMDAVIEQAASDSEMLEDLHLLRLELLRFSAQASWDSDLARTNLMAACGVHSGIQGVLTWNREMKESEKFDEATFKADHPELHAQFVIPTVTPVFNFEQTRGYLPTRLDGEVR